LDTKCFNKLDVEFAFIPFVVYNLPMSHLLVVGGICERKGSLDRLAEASCAKFGVETGESILFRDAMKQERLLQRWGKNAIIISHSAGILAVDQALRSATADEMPDRCLVLNGPEPTRISELAVRGVIKTIKHAGRILKGPYRQEQVGTLVDGAHELLLHLWGNAKDLPAISEFSTTEASIALRNRGLEALTVGIASHDDFWQPHEYGINKMESAQVVVTIYSGLHDDPLIYPNEVLAQIVA
jgi:hypothetical protein